MEEARRREDNLSESSQQVKVRLGCELQITACVLQKMCLALLGHCLTANFSCHEGHTASEVRAHRGAGGGSERERSNHSWARNGAGTGRGRPVAAGETGTQIDDRAILINRTTTTVHAQCVLMYLYTCKRNCNSFSITFWLPLWCCSFFLFYLLFLVLFSLLVIFSLFFLSATQSRFRSTHSNQCMSPTSPTLSGLRYESSICDLYYWAMNNNTKRGWTQ